MKSLIVFFRYLAVVVCFQFPLGEGIYADELKPFTSDGCSRFPDGTLEHKDLWLQCCTEHDIAYWKGGTYEERKAADETLKKCVAAVGQPEIAEIMLHGVRIGGSPYWPTDFRWGYGWSYSRGYKPLTLEEKKQVEDALKMIPSTIGQ